MQKVKLGDILPYEQPTQYIVRSTKYENKFKTPVLTAGKTFLLGKTDETVGVYTNLPCIIFDDFTTATQYVNFPFKVKSSAMKILTAANDSIDLRYFYYLMQIIKVDAQTHKRFWISEYSKIEVFLPSLAEQQRIVEKIDELFSDLDSAVADLNKAKAQLKVYRQAVLNQYIYGNENVKISDCILSMGQGWSPKCENANVTNDEEWAVIKTTAIQSRYFNFKENKRLPDTLEARPQHEICVGDILITRAGPRVRCGVACLVKKTKKRLINCDKVYSIKVNTSVVTPEYFELILNEPNFVNKIDLCKTGGNESGLNLTQDRFANLEISIADIEYQSKIVQEIESRLSLCDKIEQTVNESLIKVESLRQSILKQAFEGKLV